MLLPVAAYGLYGGQIVIDLCVIYLFIVLPLGFLLLGYSVSRRWLRVVVALGFLAAVGITVVVFNAVLEPTGEPGSAVHWYGVVCGPPVIGAGFVVALTLGLVFVPRHRAAGRCHECGYSLHGLAEPRCPECGTPFDPRLLNGNQGGGDEIGG